MVALGVNVDDLADHRPGQRAARERGAVFPLVEAGLTKDLVREAARQLGLAVWDKPAAACLASRVPYGTPVTLGTLAQVAAAEEALRALGFRDLRVRHYGDLARLEFAAGDLERAVRRSGPGGGGGAGRRLPLRDARPGRACAPATSTRRLRHRAPVAHRVDC